MRKQILGSTLPICAAIIVAGAWLASAGPPALNPPPGPVGVSGRFGTRTAISSLPFTIDQCGSYFLTDCLTGVSGQNGITVTADNVTIDLNGFALIGVNGSGDGIQVPVTISSLTVRNGSVRSWREDGVDAANARESRFENLRSYGNVGTGLKIGDYSIVENCGGANGGNGISTGGGCTITNCTANGSGGIGILAGPTNRVAGCTARLNGGHGIQVGSDSIVTDCTATDNSIGIFTGDHCTIVNCVAKGNANDGFQVNIFGTVRSCSAYVNGDDGFQVNVGSTISGCIASTNTGDGIDVNGHCLIIGNTCQFNGHNEGDGAGIFAAGVNSGNRIEGNNVTNNDRGIDVDGGGNIIIKNTASGNGTDYDIDAGNHYGEIISNPGAAFDGAATNFNAWANFSF